MLWQRGLKYIHSAGVIHGNLRPSNILINERSDLRICNFALAHVRNPLADDVPTMHYRAPEIMLEAQRLRPRVDVWSTGCIFAEMFERKPLFPGKSHYDQITIVTDLLGTPREDVMKTTCSETVSGIVCSYFTLLWRVTD